MNYTVTIHWTNKPAETHTGISRGQAQALADYTVRTYRVPVTIGLAGTYTSDTLDSIVVERDRELLRSEQRATHDYDTPRVTEAEKAEALRAAASMEEYPPGFFEEYDKDEEA